MESNAQFSYEDNPDFFSSVSSKVVAPNSRSIFKNLFKNSYSFISKYLTLLSPIDYNIAKFYYIDGLSQEQIKRVFNISQSAVSRRIRYITNRINFLLRAPSLNPIQVRRDLEFLFPEDMFEFAYFYYFELAQNRVKYFVQASQSGVANKFKDILEYLERVIENHLVLKNDRFNKDLMNIEKKRCLALTYLDYFRFINNKANIINFLCKKNDEVRSKSLILDEFIL